MKIIEHGNTIKKPDKMEFLCSYCGCRYELDSNEFKMTIKKIWLFKEKWIIFSSQCPECKREVTEMTPENASKGWYFDYYGLF